MKNNKNHVLVLVQFAIFLALEAIICFTPLGTIPFSPAVSATLAMIPVCITAVMLGTGAGTLMGFCTGLFSFIYWSFIAPAAPTAFVFTPLSSTGNYHGNFGSLLICFVPRILAGTVAGGIYTLLCKRFPKRQGIAAAAGGVLGSLTNTIGVLAGMWLFFGSQLETLNEGKWILLLLGSVILTNGIPEAVVAGILTPAVCKPLKLIAQRSSR